MILKLLEVGPSSPFPSIRTFHGSISGSHIFYHIFFHKSSFSGLFLSFSQHFQVKVRDFHVFPGLEGRVSCCAVQPSCDVGSGARLTLRPNSSPNGYSDFWGYYGNIYIYIHINLSIYQSINLSIYQSINLSIYQSINLSIYQSINLSIYQSINLSIYQSIYIRSVALVPQNFRDKPSLGLLQGHAADKTLHATADLWRAIYGGCQGTQRWKTLGLGLAT